MEVGRLTLIKTGRSCMTKETLKRAPLLYQNLYSRLYSHSTSDTIEIRRYKIIAGRLGVKRQNAYHVLREMKALGLVASFSNRFVYLVHSDHDTILKKDGFQKIVETPERDNE